MNREFVLCYQKRMFGLEALADVRGLLFVMATSSIVISIVAVSGAGSCDSSRVRSGGVLSSDSGAGQVIGPMITYAGTNGVTCKTTCGYHKHSCLMRCINKDCGSSDTCNSIVVNTKPFGDWCLCSATPWVKTAYT